MPGPGATSWGNADTCWGRSQSGLGSTRHSAPTSAGGLYAGTPMANWSKASVVYCDGASFSGNRDEPVTVHGSGSAGARENRTLYFRGQRNLDAVIDELKSRGMGSAKTAVLGGCSAGGLGALSQCDHFASQLPGVPKKRCIGDAGVFIDATSLTKFDGESVMRKQFGNVVAMQNSSLSPACLASKDNTFDGACFFPQYVLPSMTTPAFVRNSFCASTTATASGAHLTEPLRLLPLTSRLLVSADNYGEWEVLPQNWHNAHNFTPAGFKNPYCSILFRKCRCMSVDGKHFFLGNFTQAVDRSSNNI